MKEIIFLLPFLLISTSISAQKDENPNLKSCEIPKDFKEPVRDKKIEKMAKMMDKRMPGMFPSLSDIKDHVAIDNDTDASNIILLKLSEQGGNGIYEFCVNGKQMKYKRMGTVINKNGENPFEGNK
jgi:hypothetical protein